jgi:hypothetical protein
MEDELRRLRLLERELAHRATDFVEAIDVELATLRNRRDALNRAIRDLARKRSRYVAHAVAPGENRRRERPPKTVAAELVLREVAPKAMPVRELHAELLARGWSDDTARERHALEVAVRSLETSGRARRPRRGWYVANVAALEEVA